MATYTVLTSHLDSLKKEINKIAKKCVKAGISHTFKIGDSYDTVVAINNINYSFNVTDIIVDCAIRYNGWQALGCVQRKDGIIQCYFNKSAMEKDSSLILQYKDTDFHCDHCQKKVHRNSVVILEHEDGRRMTVGTSCVKEFTRGLDGNLVLAFADFEHYLNSIVFSSDDKEECLIGDSESYDSFCEKYGTRTYDVRKVVATALYVIKTHGYAKMYNFDDKVPTCIIVSNIYEDKRYTDEELIKADSIISWVLGLPASKYQLNTYLFNVRSVVESGYCTKRHFGLLSALPISYNKDIETSLKETKKESEYVGNVGDKLTITVMLTKAISYESAYGTGYIYLFKDSNENVLKWSTNKYLKDIEIGDTIELTGRVKEQDTYKQVKQTSLTRCKYTVISHTNDNTSSSNEDNDPSASWRDYDKDFLDSIFQEWEKV